MDHIEINNFRNLLELNYTKEQLNQYWYLPIKSFLNKNFDKVWDGMSGEEIFDDIGSAKVSSKGAMQNVCAKFYKNHAALTDFYNSQSKEYQQIILKATWSKSINYKDLEIIFGKPVVWAQEFSSKYGYGKNYGLVYADEIRTTWSFFMNSEDHYSYDTKSLEDYLRRENPILRFPLLLQKTYAEVLPKPDGYALLSVEQPEGTVTYNSETSIFRELPLFVAYYLQGNVKYSQKALPNVVSARKFKKLLHLTHFPGEEEFPLRAMLISGLFYDKFKMSSVSETPLKIIELLFKQNLSKRSPAPILLQHLKGINNLVSYDFHNEATPQILKVFETLPIQKWVTFKNLIVHTYSHFLDIVPLPQYTFQKLYSEIGINNGNSKRMGIINTTDYLVTPHLAGHIYLFAAFGLMELAIDEEVEPIYSYYDGLKAFKLTNLGAYILGLVNEYNAPEDTNAVKLIFDDNSTIIRAEGNLEIVDTMMSNYTVKMGENRYQFSPEKFIKDCKSTKSLEDKISLFKQTIHQKLPTFWENYLQQLKVNSTLIELRRDVRVFKLPQDNKQLHNIISQDEVLRTLIVKAEGFQVIVSDVNIPAFINRMKFFGYLIEWIGESSKGFYVKY